MFLGHQMGDLSDRKLQWAAQLGVEHIACENRSGIEREDGTWDVAGIAALKERVGRWGMSVDVLALNLPSQYITRAAHPRWGRLPSRDAEIEVISRTCAPRARGASLA